jgi:hypothetical protein
MRGCRRPECRAANTEECQRQAAERAAKRLAGQMPEHLHGTVTGYGNWSCRCDACTAAWAAKEVILRRRRGVRERRYWTTEEEIAVLEAVTRDELRVVAQQQGRKFETVRWHRYKLLAEAHVA